MVWGGANVRAIEELCGRCLLEAAVVDEEAEALKFGSTRGQGEHAGGE